MRNVNLRVIVILCVTFLTLSACDNPTSNDADNGTGDVNGDPSGGYLGASVTLPSGVISGWTETETTQVHASPFRWNYDDPFSSIVNVESDGYLPPIEMDTPVLEDLRTIDTWVDAYSGDWLSTTDEDARIAHVWGLEAFRGDDIVGYMHRTTTSGSWVQVDWIFVDRDVTVSGTETFESGSYSSETEWHLVLKTGWNRAVHQSVDTDTYPHTYTFRVDTEPAGVEWVLDDYDYD